MKPKQIFILTLIGIIAVSLFFNIQQSYKQSSLQEKLELKETLIEHYENNDREEYEEYKDVLNEVNELIEQFIEEFELEEMEVTAYAPLDPRAVEGICYEGDRLVTASGEPTEIGKTVAASEEIPFGTLVYIEDVGWREVQDRGGLIEKGDLDVAVATKEEALDFGRQTKKVLKRSDSK